MSKERDVDQYDVGDGPWVIPPSPTDVTDQDGKKFGTFAPFVVGGEDDDPPPRKPIDRPSGRPPGEPDEVSISW